MTLELRRLGPGDEALVEALATREPRTALLDDPQAVLLAALEDGSPVGFVLAYELQRRHGHAVTLCIYEIEVHEAHRRRGIGTRLLRELEALARERGVAEAFVLTEADNTAAMRLYESAGGTAEEVVMWDFDYTGD
jgi:ribosomal protein S18 acetylase RimI-like enzyme